jgi:hydrogenase-4 component B
MNELLAAEALLLAGAAICLLPMRNGWRAAAGLASQGVSLALVLSVALPVLFTGAPVEGAQRWATSSSPGPCR